MLRPLCELPWMTALAPARYSGLTVPLVSRSSCLKKAARSRIAA